MKRMVRFLYILLLNKRHARLRLMPQFTWGLVFAKISLIALVAGMFLEFFANPDPRTKKKVSTWSTGHLKEEENEENFVLINAHDK